jgi:hypothetical protein
VKRRIARTDRAATAPTLPLNPIRTAQWRLAHGRGLSTFWARTGSSRCHDTRQIRLRSLASQVDCGDAAQRLSALA